MGESKTILRPDQPKVLRSSRAEADQAVRSYSRLARPLLESILPYLREQREQVEIILKFDPKVDDANEVRDRLSLLKGNVTPERKKRKAESRSQEEFTPAGSSHKPFRWSRDSF